MLFSSFAVLAVSASVAVAMPGIGRREDPSVLIKSNANPAFCLAPASELFDNGLPVVLADCTAPTDRIGWTVANNTLITKGGYCVDVRDGAGDDGAQLQIWTCSGGPNQQIEVVDNSLRAAAFNKCLDVKDGAFTSGTGIQLWDCTSGPNQQWTVEAFQA